MLGTVVCRWFYDFKRSFGTLVRIGLELSMSLMTEALVATRTSSGTCKSSHRTRSLLHL
jgi:hypothetical protein